MAGYSGTSLIKKLGIKETTNIMLLNAPADYEEIIAADINKQITTSPAKADLVHLFVTSRKALEEEFSKIISFAKEGLVIWVSWYKKSSGRQTDVTEDVIREVVLPTGWVDVKVCAVTDLWSGLKIVKRTRLNP